MGLILDDGWLITDKDFQELQTNNRRTNYGLGTLIRTNGHPININPSWLKDE